VHCTYQGWCTGLNVAAAFSPAGMFLFVPSDTFAVALKARKCEFFTPALSDKFTYCSPAGPNFNINPHACLTAAMRIRSSEPVAVTTKQHQ